MGVVFLGQHKALNRQVAIKILSIAQAKDKLMLERFFREARSVAALDHPNIVRLFDISQGGGGVHYLVFEYVTGRDLHAVMAETGSLHFAQAAEYIAQASAGLQHAHEKGFVHRDIKPANLMLTKEGVIKILDMGLARSVSQENDNLTAALGAQSDIVGTADFISPEQALGDHVDERSDIYSLGATLFALVAGHPPFSGSVTQKLLHHQMSEVTKLQKLRGKVPDAMCDVIAKMMAKKPRDRYQTAEEVIEALSPWLTPHSSGNIARNLKAPDTGFNLASKTKATRATEVAERPTKKPTAFWNRKPVMIGAGLCFALLLAGIGFWATQETPLPEDPLLNPPAGQTTASPTTPPLPPTRFQKAINAGDFRLLPFGSAANTPVGGPMFSSQPQDKLIFEPSGSKTVLGVPFYLPDASENSNNIITLNSRMVPATEALPKSAQMPINAKVHTLHFLSGIGAWAWPFKGYNNRPETIAQQGAVTLNVKLHYVDGKTETHVWKNGEQFADFFERKDVPGSEFAMMTQNSRQVRYLTIDPEQPDVEIETIEFAKGDDNVTCPAIIAVTAELNNGQTSSATTSKKSEPTIKPPTTYAVSIESQANISTSEKVGGKPRFELADWSPKLIDGIRFELREPTDSGKLNAIQLTAVGNDKAVSLSGYLPAQSVHVLLPATSLPAKLKMGSNILKLELKYSNGESEEHAWTTEDFAPSKADPSFIELSYQPTKPLVIQTLTLSNESETIDLLVLAVTFIGR